MEASTVGCVACFSCRCTFSNLRFVGIQVEVFRQIKQFVGYNEEEEEEGIGGDGFGSPQLPPLSPPPCDPEVDALEEKVRVASERIAKLRADMQQAVQETVQKKILEKLPTATEDSEDDGAHENAAAALSDGVDAEALKDKLAHASARMPELRAKLEDVYGKLNKLLDSMDEKTEVTTEPPNTAERAMKRLYGEEKNDDAELTQDISLAP